MEIQTKPTANMFSYLSILSETQLGPKRSARHGGLATAHFTLSAGHRKCNLSHLKNKMVCTLYSLIWALVSPQLL